jgi:2-polyprenyl-3-methyl-5-hydroxy-6-metoxy-1,4-benzoquinol methylase
MQNKIIPAESLREDEIRPDDLMKQSMKLLSEGIEELMEHKSEFIEVSCVACGSDRHEQCFEKQGFAFALCKDCETVFTNPRPSMELLRSFYTSSEYVKHLNENVFPVTENIRRQKIFVPRAKRVIELCRRYKSATKNLMDVGAGFGTFCEEVASLNIFDEIIAVEPSPDLAKTCARRGIKVVQSPIEEVESESVSVITNFELVEHLYCPREFIMSCSQILQRNGLLILTTPNIKGFDLLTLGPMSDNIGGDHLNYFHPESLTCLLQDCGFEVLEMLTPGKLDIELVRKKVLCGEFNISDQPFLKLVLIEQWNSLSQPFQHFLADNLLSSHLWVVAQKK